MTEPAHEDIRLVRRTFAGVFSLDKKATGLHTSCTTSEHLLGGLVGNDYDTIIQATGQFGAGKSSLFMYIVLSYSTFHSTYQSVQECCGHQLLSSTDHNVL